MAASERAEREIENWAYVLDRSRKPEDVDRWVRVFQEHREFFITYHLQGDETLKAALRLRYTFRTYDSQTGKEYTPIEIKSLSKEEKDRLTTKPLQAEQLQTLLNTAIELHARTIEQSKESRWWIPVFVAAVSFVGAVLGAMLPSLFKASSS